MNPLERILHLITTAIAEQRSKLEGTPAECADGPAECIKVLEKLKADITGTRSSEMVRISAMSWVPKDEVQFWMDGKPVLRVTNVGGEG